MQNNNIKAQRQQTTREWIEQNNKFHDFAAEQEDEEEELSSIADSSVLESDCENEATSIESDGFDGTIVTHALGQQVPSEISSITENLKGLFNTINSVQTVGNVKIENSTNVHIGNVTNINGNIQIIHASTQQQQQQNARNAHKTGCAHCCHNGSSSSSISSSNRKTVEREERISQDAFVPKQNFKMPKQLCCIIPRSTWLAQKPLEPYEYIAEPVKLIIISHTATESSLKQAINIRILRDLQCFHIESREWNDVAYNFLIGCDGNVYEGRGWAVVGAHTRGYNTRGLGISFIGCFMRELPTELALNACKNLLKFGVKAGHIASDYQLVCHCQCRPTESPGRKLYEEIQTWQHFYKIEEEEEE